MNNEYKISIEPFFNCYAVVVTNGNTSTGLKIFRELHEAEEFMNELTQDEI